MQPKVFLSHGTDREEATFFADILRALGLYPVLVERESDPGGTPEIKVRTWLDRSDAFLLIATPDTHNADGTHHPSANVVMEVGLAKEVFKGREARLYYVKHEKVSFPSLLPDTYVPLRDGAWHEAIPQLLRNLSRGGLVSAGPPLDAAISAFYRGKLELTHQIEAELRDIVPGTPIDVIGVSTRSCFDGMRGLDLLPEAIRTGSFCRILIMDPRGDCARALRPLARRFGFPDVAQDIRGILQGPMTTLLRSLSSDARNIRGQLEVRAYSVLSTVSLMRMGDIRHVGLYYAHETGNRSPVFTIGRDLDLVVQVQRHFERLWEVSAVVCGFKDGKTTNRINKFVRKKNRKV